MSEEKDSKTIPNILQNLQSKNEGIVLKALDDVKNKGNEKVLATLLDLLFTSKSEAVISKIKTILFELKSSKAGDIIIDYLQKEISAGHRDVLVSALWQSGIACEEHLTLLVQLACDENYLTTLEVLTVVENLEGVLNEEEVMECIYTVNEALSDSEDEEKSKLLQSLAQVLEQIR